MNGKINFDPTYLEALSMQDGRPVYTTNPFIGEFKPKKEIKSRYNTKKIMNKKSYKTWEDIFPLTLIQMRFGGKYVAFNAEEDSGFVQEVNTEEVHYQLEDWLFENVDPCPYGVGDTIMEAMNNLLTSIQKYNGN